MSRVVCVLLSFLLAGLLAGCHLSKNSHGGFCWTCPKALKVGVSTDYPPLIMQKKGKITGLEVQFATGLAEAAKRPLEFVNLPRQNLMQALRKHKVDIVMAGIRADEAAQEKVQATDSYFLSGQITLMYLNAFSTYGEGTHALLGNTSVHLGVVSGSAGDVLLKRLHPRGQVSRFPSGTEGLRALLTHRIDVLINDLPSNSYYAALFVDKGLTPGVTLLTRESLVWAVNPDDKKLLHTANAYLAGLRKNGRLDEMLSQALPFYRNTAYSPTTR